MIALARLELVAMTSWRRWWFVALPTAALVWFATQALLDRAAGAVGGRPFAVNAWDAPLELLNSPVLVAYVLLPLTGLLTGQIVTADRASGYVSLTATRARGLWRVWAAKLVAVGVTTGAYLTVTCLAAVVLGGCLSGSWGWHLSDYGAATPNMTGSAAEAARYYGPPPWSGAPAPLSILPMVLYTALAMACLLCLLYVAVAAFPRSWLPLALVIATAAVFARVLPTGIWHPLLHLLWDLHTYGMGSTKVEWWASGAVMTAQLVVAFFGGWLALRHLDLVTGD